MKKIKDLIPAKMLLMGLLFAGTFVACESNFLDRNPTDILLEDQMWSNEQNVLSLLADLYDRLPEYQQIQGWWEFTNFDDAFASNAGDYWRHQEQSFPYDWWGYWDYGYIREINLFIEKGEATDQLPPEVVTRYLAEARFIRAMVYFELVKRMGGVPLILESLEYDYSGDASYLRHPRAKEHEIYDFVISEAEELKSILPDDAGQKTRATKAAALALQSRAALYAGSIANHGASTPSVSTPGGEVGIPEEMAQGYYETALRASEEIIQSGNYALYQELEDPSENFANLFLDKSSNSEMIFVKDYLENGRTHGFTFEVMPRSLREDNTSGGKLNPSLNLVQTFELLDNTFEPLQNRDPQTGEYIYYDDPLDIFANRDGRLAGTVILPGSTFRGSPVDIWAGYKLADGSIVTSNSLGGRSQLPGESGETQVVGFDGPIDQLEWATQTGFYIRKFVDLSSGSGNRGTMSDVWWVRFRYAEILLNAAEAAFELGNSALAAEYMNEVRRRAGFSEDLSPAEITFDRIVNERKVELAFENHILWDNKRWRIAHKVWNGNTTDLTENPGVADETSTRPFGLWPYRVHNPGSENHGKWVFDVRVPSPVTNAKYFRLGNYYSWISNDIRTANPLIVQNPNQ